MVVDTQMIWGGDGRKGTSLISDSCFCCFRIMQKNDDLVGHHDSCGHDMLYPQSTYSKTPPAAHRNKQQTYVGSFFTCRFPCCFANFDTNNASNLLISMLASNFDMHPIFDVLFLLQVKKHIPNNPWTFASYEEEEHKMPHFRLRICSQQPFGTMMIRLCFFS